MARERIRIPKNFVELEQIKKMYGENCTKCKKPFEINQKLLVTKKARKAQADLYHKECWESKFY